MGAAAAASDEPSLGAGSGAVATVGTSTAEAEVTASDGAVAPEAERAAPVTLPASSPSFGFLKSWRPPPPVRHALVMPAPPSGFCANKGESKVGFAHCVLTMDVAAVVVAAAVVVTTGEAVPTLTAVVAVVLGEAPTEIASVSVFLPAASAPRPSSAGPAGEDAEEGSVETVVVTARLIAENRSANCCCVCRCCVVSCAAEEEEEGEEGDATRPTVMLVAATLAAGEAGASKPFGELGLPSPVALPLA